MSQEDKKKEELYSEEENISRISFNDLLSGKVKLNNPEEERATREEIQAIFTDIVKSLSEVSKPIKGIADIVEAFNIQSEIYESFMIPSLSDAMSNYLETLEQMERNLTEEIKSYGVEYIPYELGNDIKLLKMILKSNNTADNLSTPLLGYIFTAFNTHTKEYQGKASIEGNEYIVDSEIPEEETEVKLFYDLFTELLGVSGSEEIKAEEANIGKGLVKVSMELERQRFQTKENRQTLWDQFDADFKKTDEDIEMTGLKLSDNGERVLTGLQSLLSDTNFKGHKTIQVNNTQTDTIDKLVTIYTYWNELYKYCELQKDNGKYQTYEKKKIRQGLRELTETQHLIWKKKRGKNNDLLVTHRPLITLDEHYKDISDDDIKKLRKDKDLSKTNSLLVIKYNPMFLEKIDTFYGLRPRCIYQMSKELSGGINEKTLRKLLSYLFTLSTLKYQISYKKLADVLKLDGYIKRRHTKDLLNILEDVTQKLIKGGYLLPESCYNPFYGNFVFYLNAEEFPRVKSKLKAIENKKTIGDGKK